MAVVYNCYDRELPSGCYRSMCVRCGRVIISPAFQTYCLDCALKKRDDARDDGKLSQDSCK